MRVTAALFAALLCFPNIARAQAQRSHWGISAEVAPNWQTPDLFKGMLEADSVEYRASDFRIGFVRGAILRGDWGVAYVHRNLNNPTLVVRERGRGCESCGKFLDGGATTLDGVEIHKFASFGTVARRIQIGADIAIGVGKPEGTVSQTNVAQTRGITSTDTVSADAGSLITWNGRSIDLLPMFRLDAVVTAVVAPDLKVKVSSGFDFPGYAVVTVGAVYLIGAR